MALYSKGIYEIRKKLLLTEKFIAEYCQVQLSWSYKQVMGFLFFRKLKLHFQILDPEYIFIDFTIYVNKKTICYKLHVTESTLQKWVESSTQIRVYTSPEGTKIDIISLHTFLQDSYEEGCKYSVTYYSDIGNQSIDFLHRK